jgi:membrane protein
VIITTLLILAIGMITLGTQILTTVLPESVISSRFFFGVILFTKWLITLAMLFFAISFIYYFAPAKRKQFRFISAGSSVATLMIIVTALGFNFYVDNFSKYNVLYGSIGTLLVVLVWIYFISFSLLIGFELNASILTIKKKISAKD